MPRFQELRADELTERQIELATELGATRGAGLSTGGPWGLLLRNEELCAKAASFGTMLRDGTSLPTRLSELAIITTARHWSAQFEWYAHAPKAMHAGLSEEVVEAIRLQQPPKFTATDEQAVYAFVTELHARHRVSDANYQAVVDAIGNTGAIELTAIVGFYTTVAMLIVTFDPPLPAGITRPFS